MKKVLLIGHPLGHSASPVFQNAGFKTLREEGVLKEDVVYELCDILPSELGNVIGRIRKDDVYLGCNVTIPYKVEVIKYLDRLFGLAAEDAVGAVNTVIKNSGELEGRNTDVEGFSLGLKRKLDFDLKGKHIFLAGAGGGGRAVAFQSISEEVKKIVISDIDNNKLERLQSDLYRLAAAKSIDVKITAINPVTDSDTADKEISQAELIVNATPIGMGEDRRTSVNTKVIHNGQYVFDLIYNPVETVLLSEAKKKGIKYCNGLSMLLYQGVAAFDGWMALFAGSQLPFPKAHADMEEALKKHFGVDAL
ncbi:MAG: shikimate dehydrogenase [bacterium]|nr:shikimate dehydrogenase [bacterium]